MAAVDRTTSTQPQTSSGSIKLSPLDSLFQAIISENVELVKDFFENHSTRLVNEFNKSDLGLDHLYREGRLEFFQTHVILHHIRHGGFEDTFPSDKVKTSLQTPFHLACIVGNRATIEVLLEHNGVNLEKENGSKETALSIACRCAHLDIASLLMDKGFRVSHHLKDAFGNAPWEYLLHRGIWPSWSHYPPVDQLHSVIREIVIQLLKEDGDRGQKLPDELRNKLFEDGSKDILHQVLKAITDSKMLNIFLKPSNEDLSTALHLAVTSGQSDSIDMLLETLVKLQAENNIEIQLDGSEEFGDDSTTIKDLISYLNLQDEDGWTALHYAAAAADRDTISKLLKEKIDPTIESRKPITGDAGDLALHLMDQFDSMDEAIEIHVQIKNAIYEHKTAPQREPMSKHPKSQGNENSLPATASQPPAPTKFGEPRHGDENCTRCKCWTWRPGTQKVSLLSIENLIESYDVNPGKAETELSRRDAMFWCHIPLNRVRRAFSPPITC